MNDELLRLLLDEVRGLRDEVRAAVLDRNAAATAAVILSAAFDAFGARAFTAAELLDHACVQFPGRRLLRAALRDSARAVGKQLAELQDRAIGGLVLRAEQGRVCLLYRVAQVSEPQNCAWPTWPPSGSVGA